MANPKRQRQMTQQDDKKEKLFFFFLFFEGALEKEEKMDTLFILKQIIQILIKWIQIELENGLK